MDGSGELRICLLGELTATYDDQSLDLGGRRQRAVLALLLLARGEVVPADRLAESLWGDDPPANVPGALQSYVSHLRRRLQPGSAARARSGVIVSEGPGYAVRLPRDAVDTWRFEAMLQQAAAGTDPAQVAELLGKALGLWRGPALADYADEPWAAPEVARLTDLRAVADEQLLAARLGRGEAVLLVPELEAMVADQPLREERWRLLVLALYRSHRQADALAALRRARGTLADELGVDPGPALRALEAEVLAQSPSLDVPAQRRPVAVTGPSAAPPHDDLVDRDREVAALVQALDDLAAGESRLLLVEGPAGIGKSRLLTEARHLAEERSHRVLTARGSQLEKAFGFGAVRQLFEPVLVDPRARGELLDGAAASARGVFDLVDAEQADGSFAVLHGLYWLTVNLAATGPVVLAVDDLQWCDSASLRYLAYLVRRLEGLPVLIVGTVRTGEQHDDEELLTELGLEPATVAVRPAPLSEESTAGMVRRRLGEPAAPSFTAACHRTTSGNPLLLRQLLRALEADGVRPDAAHADTVMAVGSRAVSSMVLMRLRRMPTEVTTVARAVAVLGDGAQLPAVAALAQLSEDHTATALAALTRAEVVNDEQPLGFVHPLIRDAVYRDLPAAERELQHERAVAVLRRTAASAEQVAAHLLLAPHRGDPGTVATLRSAARTAADRGASDSAVVYLRRALDEPVDGAARVDVLLELGLMESLLDGPASAEHLLAAYPSITDPRTRGEIAIAIARTHVFASPPGVATSFARRAAATLPSELADVQQGLLALQRISGFTQGIDPAVWRSGPEPQPTGRGHGAQMLAATLSWETVIAGVDRARAVDLARFALDGHRLWKVDNGLLWVVAAMTRMVADDDLGDFWHVALAEAHSRGSLFAAMSANVWRGFWEWRRGELADALMSLRAGEEQDRMWGGSGVGVLFTRAFMAGVHLDRGDLLAARGVVDQALGGALQGEGGRLVRQVHCRLLAAEGRPVEALAALDAVDDPIGIENPAWNPWRSLRASALHGSGRTDEAIALVQEEVARLRRWGAPTYLGAALRLLGELSDGAGLEHLREAVRVLTPTAAAVELARARCALGSVAAVDDDEAVPLLQAALEVAHACGANGVREMACSALARRGRSGDPTCSAGPVLSTTERRIRDLTAAGLDVRAVAQQLFLTPGTVRAALDAASAEATG